jgi:hypothetical protein
VISCCAGNLHGGSGARAPIALTYTFASSSSCSSTDFSTRWSAFARVGALDALVAGHRTHALVVGVGVDGDTGLVRITRGDA